MPVVTGGGVTPPLPAPGPAWLGPGPAPPAPGAEPPPAELHARRASGMRAKRAHTGRKAMPAGECPRRSPRSEDRQSTAHSRLAAIFRSEAVARRPSAQVSCPCFGLVVGLRTLQRVRVVRRVALASTASTSSLARECHRPSQQHRQREVELEQRPLYDALARRDGLAPTDHVFLSARVAPPTALALRSARNLVRPLQLAIEGKQ
jgi:hypothetical protein